MADYASRLGKNGFLGWPVLRFAGPPYELTIARFLTPTLPTDRQEHCSAIEAQPGVVASSGDGQGRAMNQWLFIFCFGVVIMLMLIHGFGVVVTGDPTDSFLATAKVTNSQPSCTEFSGMSYDIRCKGPRPDQGYIVPRR
jgi:hypothetical protein